MYDIYINYFMDDSSPNPITTERKMFSVPITENRENALTDPVVKTEMGKTGTFEFSVSPDHPYYNAWLQMKTIMRVEFSGDTIFRGRVLTIDNQPMTGVKRIHLEGDYAFFMDSYQEGIPDKDRTERSVETYLNEIITAHNSQMNVAGSMHKKFELGAVPGTYDQNGTSAEQRVHCDTRRYGGSSWRRTSDALDELTKEFGGYFRTRYDKTTGICYLDWLDQCFNPTVNSQPIELTENLIDISSVSEVDNLFTVLVPVGSAKGKAIYVDGYNGHSGKAITVPQAAAYFVNAGRAAELDRRYHSRTEYENAINNYGVIYKTQAFSNADAQEKLWNYAMDWIKENYLGGVSSFTVNALDCHHVDPEKQKYITGDLVPVAYPNMAYKAHGGDRLIRKTLTITSVKYELYHPEKNEYSTGTPSGTVSKTYGTSSGKKKASKTVGETVGSSPFTLPEIEFERKATTEELNQYAWEYIIDAKYNNKRYQELAEKSPESAESALQMAHAAILRNITPEDDPEYWALNRHIDSVLIDGPRAKIMLQRSLPKEVQQELVRQGELTPSLRPGPKTWEKQNVAIELVADKYVSKLSMAERLDIDPRMVVTDKVRAAKLLAKGDRKTLLDFGLEHGLMKDPSTANPLERPQAQMRMLRFVQANKTDQDAYGYTNATRKVGANAMGDLGALYSEVVGVGTQGLPGSATMQFDGENGTVKTVNPVDAGNFLSNKLTSFWDTAQGKINSIKAAFGINGSGGKSTIDLDGVLALFNIRPADKAGEANTETFEANGSGEVKAGKSGSNWRITMNTPFTYHDGKGVEHTLPAGGVRAEDFQLYSSAHQVESFCTEFAYIDTAVVRDLYAMKAYIDKINANTISANSYVASDLGWFNNINCNGNMVMNGAGTKYYAYQTSNGTYRYLNKCLYDLSISEASGKITVTGTRLDGSTASSATFNMAGTTFYRNAVSAARNQGRLDVYSSNISIAAGKSDTFYLKYIDPDTQEEMNTGKTFKVTASGSSVVGGTIDIPNSGLDRLDKEPSGTKLAVMRDTIANAVRNHQYFRFVVNVLDGSTIISTKTYYMKFS